MVKGIIDGIGKHLSDKFEELRPLYYNPNTKGHGYEKVLKDILNDYLGSIVSLHNRCALIDRKLKLLTIFTPQENEFDVVATFNNACPRIVLQKDPLKYIPLDAVAFLIEVKQTLTKTNLKKDLYKMENISTSETSGRFGVTFKGAYSVSYPLKVLAYYEEQISKEEFIKILNKHREYWEMILLVKEDILYVNPTMPWVQKRWKKPVIEKFHPHALLWLLLILSLSFTISPITNTATTLVNMWNSYYGLKLVD